jgi:hypothetical protein
LRVIGFETKQIETNLRSILRNPRQLICILERQSMLYSVCATWYWGHSISECFNSRKHQSCLVFTFSVFTPHRLALLLDCSSEHDRAVTDRPAKLQLKPDSYTSAETNHGIISRFIGLEH